MKFTAALFSLIITLVFTGIDPLSAQTVWLDQLDLSAATQGFGAPGKSKSVDGKPITIGGQTFSRGFGTHAESALSIKLDGHATISLISKISKIPVQTNSMRTAETYIL